MKILHVLPHMPKAAGTSVFCGEIACEGVAEPLSVEARGRPVPYEWKGGRLRIRLPYDRVDNLTTVVDVECKDDCESCIILTRCF